MLIRVEVLERKVAIVTDLIERLHDGWPIRRAVEQQFNVKVAEVRISNTHGKERRQGRYVGRRPDWKKAYVRLAEGEKPIEFFEGV